MITGAWVFSVIFGILAPTALLSLLGITVIGQMIYEKQPPFRSVGMRRLGYSNAMKRFGGKAYDGPSSRIDHSKMKPKHYRAYARGYDKGLEKAVRMKVSTKTGQETIEDIHESRDKIHRRIQEARREVAAWQ